MSLTRLAVLTWGSFACTAPAEPVRLLSGNSHYFSFRGRPVVLMGSSEHYGSIINLDFDYITYLEECRASGLNFVRVFTGAYREAPGSFNIPENTLVPLPGRAVAPWPRTQTPGAADGGRKFDLNRWDPVYFHRLRQFATAAANRGIVVELTLFGAFYDDGLWALSPMNASNHVNGVGAAGRANSHSVTGDLLPYQKALALKCAQELRTHDNVIYEICNEPYQGNITQAWQDLIASEVVAADAGLPRPHLIAQNVFNFQGVVSNPNPKVSILNFHYATPAAASQNLGLNRALGDDETGIAGQQDLTYRREAWEFMMAGGGLFNHLDFSFTTSRADGISPQIAPGGGGPNLRHQLGILRWFLEELPLANVTPQPNFVMGGVPAGGAAAAIGAPGIAYGLYLRGGSQANLVVNLPAGNFSGVWIDPRSGGVIATVAGFTHSGGQRTLISPSYGEDIALLLQGGDSPPPVVAITSPGYNHLVASTSTALTLEAQASVQGGAIQSVEFFDGETSLGLSTVPPYQLSLPEVSRGRHIFRAKATAASGRTASSPPIKTTVGGAFHSGVNLNGGALVADGVILQSEASAVAAGMVVGNAQGSDTSGSLTFYPAPVDATATLLRKHLIRASASGNAELGLAYPLGNGAYDVYLFIAEDQTGYSRDMRVQVEGQTVARGIGDLPKGAWHKYGPYRTRVTDAVLNLGLLQETKGVPRIAAFSIYQADPSPVAADVALQIEHDDGLVVLSYPAGLPNPRIQSSITMADPWLMIDAPVSRFAGSDVVPIPLDGPSRFYRLRTD